MSFFERKGPFPLISIIELINCDPKGLEDKTYLEPFNQMIKEERNFSDEIVDYAKSTGLEKQDRIKGSAAKILRNYIADSYEKDLLN